MFVETTREGEIAVPLEQWRNILLDAANLIEQHGHCKNSLQTESGNLCAVGALNMAETGNARKSGSDVVAWGMLKEAVGGDIVDWNNAPERTATEVTGLMRKAARS